MSGRQLPEQSMIEIKPLFQLKANVDPPQIIEGPLGQRLFIPVTGGSLCGDRISGVVQAGGSDFQLIRQDGVAELDVRVNRYGMRWTLPTTRAFDLSLFH
jgi:hypothetical protein